MTKTKLTIILLAVALVLSNVWWAYRVLDTGVSLTYMGVSLEDNEQALAQTIALLPVAGKHGVSRTEILAAARFPGDASVPFEKDGFVWTGKIGLKFNEWGQLVEVSRAWSPP